MTIFITEFKNRAHKKNLSSSDMLALCAYRAIKAKSPNKIEIFRFFTKKAFTPKYGHDWSAAYAARDQLRRDISERISRAADGNLVKKRSLWGVDLNEMFATNEIEMLDELLSELFTEWN